MSQDPNIRVVVGEAAEPRPGLARLVLDVEGFEVVGHASSKPDLEQVLEDAQPTVVVLDAGITAAAVLAVRERTPAAKVVVVWPEGVSGAVADEQVHPARVTRDLVGAVRRAAYQQQLENPQPSTASPVVRLPGAEPELVRPLAPTSLAARAPGRGASVLAGVAAVVAMLVFVIGVAFALEGTLPTRPSAASRSERSLTPSAVASPTGAPLERGARPDGRGCRQHAPTDARGASSQHRNDHAAKGGPPATCGKNHGHDDHGVGAGHGPHANQGSLPGGSDGHQSNPSGPGAAPDHTASGGATGDGTPDHGTDGGDGSGSPGGHGQHGRDGVTTSPRHEHPHGKPGDR